MAFQKFKNSVKRILTGHEAGINSFSQAGEDMILRSIFRLKLNRQETGFFIDIGAYHPTSMSNTYAFYIAGWRGINVDPRPGSMNEFKRIRPKDINLEIGVGAQQQTLLYHFISEESTMNSFSEEFLQQTGMFHKVVKKIPVPVYPLHEILKKHNKQNKKVDFLNLDVEGMDLEIIKSISWNSFKPSVVVIEGASRTLRDAEMSEITLFLKNVGYNAVAKNVVTKGVASIFFIDEEFDY